MPDEVMTVADVAARLKAAPSTVYEMIKRGELPAKRIGRTRGLRVAVKAFQAWLDSPDNQGDNRT
jgi:excisionase family DNA binding protein